MNLAMFPLILLAVMLNAGAQLALKAGMSVIGYFDFNLSKLFSIGLQVALNPYIILGLSCYVFSVLVWLLVLSRVDVSIAYPMISMSFIVNAVAAYYLFGEQISVARLSGIVIILFGVFIVARS